MWKCSEVEWSLRRPVRRTFSAKLLQIFYIKEKGAEYLYTLPITGSKDYELTRFAFKLIGVDARALDTGQLTLASCAIRRNVASSMPGTTASF